MAKATMKKRKVAPAKALAAAAAAAAPAAAAAAPAAAAASEPVTAATSRFPQYLRAGFRAMMPFHEDVLADAKARKLQVIEVDDKSLGCVVVARNGGRPVTAMISMKLSNPREAPFWAFPKGHPDAGESDVVGAAREVREEVGLDVARAIKPRVFCEEAYTYAGRLHKDAWARHAAFPDEAKRPVTVFYKTVRCFLAVLDRAPPLKAQEEEVGACEWVSLEDVEARMAARKDMRDLYVSFLRSRAVQDAIRGPPAAAGRKAAPAKKAGASAKRGAARR